MTAAIRWTKEQFADHAKKRATAGERMDPLSVPIPAVDRARKAAKRADLRVLVNCCRVPMMIQFRSKEEIEWAARLEDRFEEGHFRSWKYEAIKVRIGAKAWSKPDFSVYHHSGRIEIQEVKGGFIREAGRLRLQTAVKQYPEFAWKLAQWTNGEWNIENL